MQKKRGRPRKPESEKAVRVQITLHPLLAEKFKLLGGSPWLAAHLRKQKNTPPG